LRALPYIFEHPGKIVANETHSVPYELAGMTSIVTGGGSGIGRAIALAFAAEGAAVAILDMKQESADAVSQEIKAMGGKSAAWQKNVSDATAVPDVIASIEKTLGPIDVLVNSAGIRDVSSCLELSLELWASVVSVNLTGPFIWSQAVARRMVIRGSGGAIINIASVAALSAVADRTAYVSSKHGLVGLTKIFALELGKHGIRVNAIAPSGVDTPMAADALSRVPDAAEVVRRSCPMGRLARPQEVADLAVYLASPRASFVTGSIIPIDGGFLTGRLT